MLTAYRAPLELREYPVPDTGAGEALIRVEMAGVCGTDVHLATGSSVPTDSVIGAGCALTTVLHGLERATIALGDVVVIQGTGPVGLAAVAVSLQCGASRVVVIGAPERRLRLATEFGAAATISIEDLTDVAARRDRVAAEVGPHGADVVIECVGRPQAVPEGGNSAATAAILGSWPVMPTPAK